LNIFKFFNYIFRTSGPIRALKWGRAKKNGYLETEDYTKLLDERGHHSTILKLPNFSSKDLVNLCYKARKEYYLRFDYIIYKIWQSIKSPSEAIRTLKSAKIFLKHLKSD